jgi:hypothetical protein
MTDNGQYETFFEILRTDFSEFYNPSENWAVDSHCEIRGKSSIQAVHKKKLLVIKVYGVCGSTGDVARVQRGV